MVNRRLAGLIHDTRVYKSTVFYVKSKYHHLVMSRVNLEKVLNRVAGKYIEENEKVYDTLGVKEDLFLRKI